MELLTNHCSAYDYTTIFLNTLYPREIHKLNNSNDLFSKFDGKIHENEMPLKVRDT